MIPPTISNVQVQDLEVTNKEIKGSQPASTTWIILEIPSDIAYEVRA